MKLVRRTGFYFFVLLLAMGLSSSIAWSQEKKPKEHRANDVTVTATKIEKDINQLTDAVTVIDEAEIKKSGLTDMTDILRFTPGIGFKRAGGPGQYVYTKMRGFSDGHFSVIIDGMKINEGMSAGTGNLFSKLDPFLIQRIEILRGPQSALYGSDTTAGVMSYTTKGGVPGSQGSVGAEYGTYNWKKGYAGVRGTHEGFRYSVNAIYADSDGIHEHEDFRNFSPQIKLGWGHKDVFDAELSYMRIDSKWNYARLIENWSHVTSRSQWYGFQVPDPERWNKETYDLATLNLKHKINDALRQKLMVGWYKKKTESNNPNNGLLGFITAPQDNFTLDYQNYYNKGDRVPVYDDGDGVPYYYENQNYQADYNLIWDQGFGAGKNTILFGLEWLTQKGKKWGKYGDADEKLETKSVYLNDQLLLLDESLIFNAGVRYDDHKEFENEFTYKLGAAYIVKSSGTTFFANYGTSFRAPSITNLYDPKYGNKDLTPEKGWTVEGGVRQDLLDKRLHFELVGWHTDLDEVIAFMYTGTYEGHYYNRDNQKTQGVEFNFFWNFYGDWALLGNYTYTDSQSENDGETFRTVQIARNTGNLGLQYNWAEKIFVGINGYYVGPRLRWNGDIEMDSYVRVDLYGRYNFWKGLSVYGRVNNAFDQDIEEGLGYEQPGVYIVAGLSWDFSLAN